LQIDLQKKSFNIREKKRKTTIAGGERHGNREMRDGLREKVKMYVPGSVTGRSDGVEERVGA
jgi:hypothetical protein